MTNINRKNQLFSYLNVVKPKKIKKKQQKKKPIGLRMFYSHPNLNYFHQIADINNNED